METKKHRNATGNQIKTKNKAGTSSIGESAYLQGQEKINTMLKE